VVKGKMVDDH